MKSFYAHFKYLLFLLVLSWCGTACKKKDTGPIPTYVHIDSFNFVVRPLPNVKAASTHKITAVWVFYNNNPVGVYDLPATIPVITDGSSGQLSLRPGIAMSGLNNFMTPYPFYAADTSTLISQPGKIVNYTPNTTFASAVNFTVISTFDSTTGSRFMPVDGSVAMKINHPREEGLLALAVPTDTMGEDTSTMRFKIDPTREGFIEFDYKNTVPFAVGLRANLSGVVFLKYYLGGAYPSDTWQKFYLSVRDFAAQYKGDDYNFCIKASLPGGSSTGTVLIDNIQLVYFE